MDKGYPKKIYPIKGTVVVGTLRILGGLRLAFQK
jgi:hypothetical protein